jgi:FKBP-type peptidyl-prolyl cis-trans isomerase (trigger factor)
MLKFLRKKTKIIVWTVMVAFVSWGGYAVSLQFQESSRSPGRLFGKEVSFRDYLLAQRAVQLFLPASEPEAEPPSAEQIEARTWQFLILSREAKRHKLKVTDDEVRQQVALLLTQAGGAGLSKEQYLQWVRSRLRQEPRQFEDQVREQLRIQKLLDEARKGLGEDPDGKKLLSWLQELVESARIEVYKPLT